MRTRANASSEFGKRRRDRFAPLAIPVSLPKSSLRKVTILSLSPYGRHRNMMAGLTSDTGTDRDKHPHVTLTRGGPAISFPQLLQAPTSFKRSQRGVG